MMNKTIAEQFIDEWAKYGTNGRDCIANAISRLESRLSTLETLMKIGQDNDVSLANRIIALENIIACDGIDARLHQPPTPEQKPAETKNVNLSCEFDATVWAKEWIRVIKEHPQVPTDEGTMIGWFANAIMAGYDHDGLLYEHRARLAKDES